MPIEDPPHPSAPQGAATDLLAALDMTMRSHAKPVAESPVRDLVSRISVSLPPALLGELDRMVASRGYDSRSQAIADMVTAQIAEHKRKLGNEVMVGTVTLLYDRTANGLPKRLADLQYRHIDEVVSSLHVHLTHDQVMEVVLVQGPAQKVQDIANEMIALRGVVSGRLQLLSAVIPPLHGESGKH